jgi:hypothetical protein
MITVTVNPVNVVGVRVNQSTQATVPSTSVFSGAVNVQEQVNEAIAIATAASTTANSAYVLANSISSTSNSAFLYAQSAFNTSNNALVVAQSAFDNSNTKLSLTGGTVNGDLTVSGVFSTTNDIVDAGTF